MRRFPSTGLLLLVALIASVATGPAGCRELESDQALPGETCVDPPKTVRQTFDCLRLWHSRGAYAAMRPYLDPKTGEDFVDLLVAMDELLAANAGAQVAIRRACPDVDPARFDLSFLQQYMELFSKDVEYVREQDQNARAVVTVQIGKRMPLKELQFLRHRESRGKSRWMYVPGGEVPKLVTLIREVARSLSQITLVLSQAKNVTPEMVQNEYEIRIWRRVLKKADLAEKTTATSPQG